MEQEQETREISVTWRGKMYVVDMDLSASIEELGQELQKLTGVKPDTMRLIVQSHKKSKLLSPFSDDHARQSLLETSISEGKSIQMMGVPKDEIDQILKNAKTDMRIAGFDEEEKRHRQRLSYGPNAPLKLPEGTYVFCEFRTLSLPGIELYPPASEALRLMHKLAADPGIVAIMNKHRWRVGIMTEMAPEGKVGVSPVCILGLNKNKGEEISLRLRTDDLKGFRKYAVIKKTLLHELAHMVHSEHDAKFYALDSQLNKEAENLDWTRSKGHTLSGARQSQYYIEEYDDTSTSLSHKLGGGNSSLNLLANARASSVAAAYQRLSNASNNLSSESEVQKPIRLNDSEPDPDDDQEIQVCTQNKVEPDPDDSMDVDPFESESYKESNESRVSSEPDPDDSTMELPVEVTELNLSRESTYEEPDPDDLEVLRKDHMEPDPDDSAVSQIGSDGNSRSDIGNSHLDGGAMQTKPDPDDDMVHDQGILRAQSKEPDPDDDQELQRIQDPVKVICSRLQKAIDMLQSEVNPSQAAAVLQTLFRIIKNVIEHPDEMKYRKLRKANPVIQRNIVSYQAGMEFLQLIGFAEDVILEELGNAETYLVLKRNDPGLLWLAKSSLETCIAF